MKIAMISGGGGSGGLVAYIRGLLSVKTEDEVLFVCTQALREKLGAVAENVQFCALAEAKERGAELLRNKPLDAKVVQVVDDFCPDIVLYINGWIRRGLEKYPNVMILHNQLYVDNQALKQTLTLKKAASLLSFRHIVRRSMKKADGVIFLSDKSMWDAKAAGVKFNKGGVAYFGIPEENFSACPAEHTSNEKLKLLYVSTFWGYKNHSSLLDALKLLKDKGFSFEMHFVGAGPTKGEMQIKEKVKVLGLDGDVVFHGNKSHDKVLEAMDESDIFVYPSAVESTGLGVMEAMARGMCIASSDMSCMPSVLKDAGVYFSPKQPQSIADAIEQLLRDASMRTTLSKKAWELAKQYTWESAVAQTIAFLENTAEKRQSEQGA